MAPWLIGLIHLSMPTAAPTDDKTIALHQVARFKFVPWMARMLGGDTIPRDEGAELPIGEFEALTDETVVAIQEISNQSCWKFLLQDCGWRKLDAVKFNDEDSHSIRRLWDESASLPELTFSTGTPDLLLTVFNGTRRGKSIARIAMPDCLASNGDLVIHHLLFRKLHSNPKSLGLDYDHQWLPWYSNPLNALYDPKAYGGNDRVSVRWDRLFDEDMVPFVPWVFSYLIEHWSVSSTPFFHEGLDKQLNWLRGITFLLNGWLEQCHAAGRIDCANSLVDLLAYFEASREADLHKFEEYNEGESIKLRQQRAADWVDFLELGEKLEKASCQGFDIHPVERTGAQKCFLAKWEASDFRHTLTGLRELSQALRPSFN